MNRNAFTLAAAACLVAAGAQAQPKPEGYLCCNMRSDGRWISDSNYQESGKFVIPLGTPVKVTDYARYRVSVKLLDPVNGTQTLGNDYSRELAMPDFARRYVVPEDPQLKLRSLPKKLQDAIASMRVTRGMTREQVLMAIGYPIASETPHLDSKVWKYWLWTFSPYDIYFDDRGVVTDIQTDPDTRMRVVLD
jgi:hypothetical protein